MQAESTPKTADDKSRPLPLSIGDSALGSNDTDPSSLPAEVTPCRRNRRKIAATVSFTSPQRGVVATLGMNQRRAGGGVVVSSAPRPPSAAAAAAMCPEDLGEPAAGEEPVRPFSETPSRKAGKKSASVTPHRPLDKSEGSSSPSGKGPTQRSSSSMSPFAASGPMSEEGRSVSDDVEPHKRRVPRTVSETVSSATDESPNSVESPSASQRGLVSRRGGRLGNPSPARSSSSMLAPPAGRGIKLNPRKSNARYTCSDTVPSLCSAPSAGMHSASSGGSFGNEGGHHSPLHRTSKGWAGRAPGGAPSAAKPSVKVGTNPGRGRFESDDAEALEAEERGGRLPGFRQRKPASITCDTSLVDETSPLQPSMDDPADASSPEGDGNKESESLKHRRKRSSSSENEIAFGEDSGEASESKATRNRAMSPVLGGTLEKKVPIKSPTPNQYIPSIHDAKLSLQSPCALFLSPYSPSSSAYGAIAASPTEEKPDDGEPKADRDSNIRSDPSKKSTKKEEAAARESEREGERGGGVTPTNFASDFGKGPQPSPSPGFSNVYSWLTSPTGHGFFSPGGLASATNTPRGMYGFSSANSKGQRTPRTPNMGTSFFFSDVEALPRDGDVTSPKPGGSIGGGQRGGGPSSQQNQSIICISPLASKRTGNRMHSLPKGSNTPINYNAVFDSPQVPYLRGNFDKGTPRGWPLFGEDTTPIKKKTGKQAGPPSSQQKGKKGGRKGNTLDAVSMAERDLMEDEDLSVLLQLAGTSSKSNSASKARPLSGSEDPRLQSRTGRASPDPPSSLQMPLINVGPGSGSPSKLSRKGAFRDSPTMHLKEFTPPQLAIRSTSSSHSSTRSPPRSSGERRVPFSAAKGPGTSDGPAKKNRGGKTKNGPMEVKSSMQHPSSAAAAAAAAAAAGNHHQAPPSAFPPQHMHPHQHHQRPHPGSGHGPPPPHHMPPYGAHRPQVLNPYAPQRVPSSHKKQKGPKGMNSAPTSVPYSYNHPHPGMPPNHSHSHGVYPHHHPHMAPGPYHHMQYPPPHHSHQHHHMYGGNHHSNGHEREVNHDENVTGKKVPKPKSPKAGTKRLSSPTAKGGSGNKKAKKSPKSGSKKPKTAAATAAAANKPVDRKKAAAAIAAVNAAAGGENDKAAALAAAIMRGVTMRPSGKWQAQLYYAGKSRYIGVFDTREKAALAYEIAREVLKSDNKSPSEQGSQTPQATEAAVNAARKAAFAGVNETDPRAPK